MKFVIPIILLLVFSLLLGDCASEPTDEAKVIQIIVGGIRLEAILAQNPSVDALIGELEKSDLTYVASDYGGFEKVGYLGRTLVRGDEYIAARAGDVMLYQGDRICIFFGSNSSSYTRIGRISGYSAAELRTILGAAKGDMEITLSIDKGEENE